MKIANKSLTIEERLNLLTKSNWDYKDIAAYFGCCNTKAIEIKKKARIKNGGYPVYLKDQVTIEAVFDVQGIKLADELSRLGAIKAIYDSELQVGVA